MCSWPHQLRVTHISYQNQNYDTIQNDKIVGTCSERKLIKNSTQKRNSPNLTIVDFIDT